MVLGTAVLILATLIALSSAHIVRLSLTAGPSRSPESGANLTSAAPDIQPLDVVACLAVKDQHHEIREWLEHHRALGVRLFYVFDHGSQPPLDQGLQDFIGKGTVKYIPFGHCHASSGCHRAQLTIYQTCLDKYREHHDWMLFIDADEFVAFTDSTARLDSFLMEFADAGALAINWIVDPVTCGRVQTHAENMRMEKAESALQTFGSSGLMEASPEGVRKSFHACLPEMHETNRHIKSIANLKYTVHTGGNPHELKYETGKQAVNENHQPVEGPRTDDVSVARIALYHYAIKSLAEFHSKTRRGSGMGNTKTMEYFELTDSQAIHNCTILLERT